jgi:hypothetical protein
MFRGENGTARFNGLGWGYSGEGPRGTVEVLVAFGVNKQAAEQLVFHNTSWPSFDKPQQCWEIDLAV